MSGIKDTATVSLIVNGQQARQELDAIKSKLETAKNKLADLQAAGGDTKSIRRAIADVRKYERQLDMATSKLEGVRRALENMDRQSPHQLNRSLKVLINQLHGLEQGTKEWDAHVEAIRKVKARLRELNDELKVHQSFWERCVSWVNKWQTMIVGAIAGSGTVMDFFRKSVDAYASMDQEMANVRKFTGMTAEQVEDLNEELKKIDTRSSREQLNKLAQEAGRLGLSSQEDVLGFVRAADKINVALDDLGDGATLTLSKLTDIFGDKDRFGVEQSLLKTGSVINDLSQICSASAPYLADFAKRMGGVGVQANLTVSQIMGLGAVLDSLGLEVEASSTAVSQVLVRMMQDPAKYAKAAGLDVKKFSDMLKTDVNGALLLFLETLNQAGGMNVLAPMFADMGENGSRAITTLSSLAKSIDIVRLRQEQAAAAFEEGTSIDKEYEVQNTTVLASIDKAKNRFQELRIELGKKLSPLMAHVLSSTSAIARAIMVVIDFCIAYKTEIIALGAALAVYKGVIAAHILLLDVAAVKTALVTKATTAWHLVTSTLSGVIAVGRLAIAGMTNAIQYLTNGLNVNYTMQQRWRKAMAGMSFASWTGLIIGVATAVFLLYRRLKALEEERLVVEKIQADAIKKVGEERVEIDLLVSAAENERLSLEERKKAIEKLNAIIPNYNAQLDETSGKYKANKKALDDYIQSLTRKYELEGAKNKLAEIGKEKADASLALRDAQANYDKAKAASDSGTGWTYTSSWGTVGNTATDATSYFKSTLDYAKSNYEEILRKEKRILDAYGVELQKDAASAENSGEADVVPEEHIPPRITPTDNDPNKSKERFAGEKAWREHEEASARIAYAKGEATYSQHMARMAEIEAEYYKKVLDRADVVGEEKHQVEASYQESSRKQKEANNKRSVAEEEKDYQDLLDRFRTNHQKRLSQEGLSAQDRQREQEYYAEVLELAELQHLQNILDIYEKGSDEWLEAQRNLQNKEIAAQERHLKKMERQQQEYANIKKKVFGMSQSEKDDEFKKQFDALTAVYNQELAAVGDNEAEKLRIKEAYMAAELALRKEYNQAGAEDTKSAYETAIGKSAEWLQGDGGKALTGAISTLTSGMSSIFSGLSSMIQAEIEVQTAKIEKRYDREIELAQGNSYKVAKLEKQKQKQIAKMKNEANKKMFAMQVIQAVAQTAQNALGAYGSTVVIPVVGKILAPIAAAAAIAAGMIQVAAIKKQQQAAEAQGYSKGGFTKPGAVDEPAGIVHAGEWVASQKLLASPIARPMIEALDYVQRTNTIGSLRPEDVSRSIRANDSLVRIAEDGSSGALVVAAVARNAQAVDALVARLNEPFVTVNTVTGDHGIKQAQDEYSRLMDNVTPKSKRKK